MEPDEILPEGNQFVVDTPYGRVNIYPADGTLVVNIDFVPGSAALDVWVGNDKVYELYP